VHLPAHLAARLEVYRRSAKLRTKLEHECREARHAGACAAPWLGPRPYSLRARLLWRPRSSSPSLHVQPWLRAPGCRGWLPDLGSACCWGRQVVRARAALAAARARGGVDHNAANILAVAPLLDAGWGCPGWPNTEPSRPWGAPRTPRDSGPGSPPAGLPGPCPGSFPAGRCAWPPGGVAGWADRPAQAALAAAGRERHWRRHMRTWGAGGDPPDAPIANSPGSGSQQRPSTAPAAAGERARGAAAELFLARSSARWRTRSGALRLSSASTGSAASAAGRASSAGPAAPSGDGQGSTVSAPDCGNGVPPSPRHGSSAARFSPRASRLGPSAPAGGASRSAQAASRSAAALHAGATGAVEERMGTEPAGAMPHADQPPARGSTPGPGRPRRPTDEARDPAAWCPASLEEQPEGASSALLGGGSFAIATRYGSAAVARGSARRSMLAHAASRAMPGMLGDALEPDAGLAGASQPASAAAAAATGGGCAAARPSSRAWEPMPGPVSAPRPGTTALGLPQPGASFSGRASSATLEAAGPDARPAGRASSAAPTSPGRGGSPYGRALAGRPSSAAPAPAGCAGDRSRWPSGPAPAARQEHRSSAAAWAGPALLAVAARPSLEGVCGASQGAQRGTLGLGRPGSAAVYAPAQSAPAWGASAQGPAAARRPGTAPATPGVAGGPRLARPGSGGSPTSRRARSAQPAPHPATSNPANARHISMQIGQEGVEVPAAGHLRAVAAAVMERALPALSIVAGMFGSGRAWSPPPQHSQRRSYMLEPAVTCRRMVSKSLPAACTASQREGAEHYGWSCARARSRGPSEFRLHPHQRRPRSSAYWTCKHNL